MIFPQPQTKFETFLQVHDQQGIERTVPGPDDSLWFHEHQDSTRKSPGIFSDRPGNVLRFPRRDACTWVSSNWAVATARRTRPRRSSRLQHKLRQASREGRNRLGRNRKPRREYSSVWFCCRCDACRATGDWTGLRPQHYGALLSHPRLFCQKSTTVRCLGSTGAREVRRVGPVRVLWGEAVTHYSRPSESCATAEAIAWKRQVCLWGNDGAKRRKPQRVAHSYLLPHPLEEWNSTAK